MSANRGSFAARIPSTVTDQDSARFIVEAMLEVMHAPKELIRKTSMTASICKRRTRSPGIAVARRIQS